MPTIQRAPFPPRLLRRYQNVLGGRQLSEDEIAGLLIAVLFAGQHTSSITSAWTGYYMIHNKVRP